MIEIPEELFVMAQLGRVYPFGFRRDLNLWPNVAGLPKTWKTIFSPITSGSGTLWPAWAGQKVFSHEATYSSDWKTCTWRFINPPGATAAETLDLDIRFLADHTLRFEGRWRWSDGVGHTVNCAYAGPFGGTIWRSCNPGGNMMFTYPAIFNTFINGAGAVNWDGT